MLSRLKTIFYPLNGVIVWLCLPLLIALSVGFTIKAQAAPLVVVDAGHGGWDSGAVGPRGYKEKDANLSISLRAKAVLESYGYQVMLTRSTDTALGSDLLSDLQGRVDIANSNKANVFVSIHNNSGPSGAKGTETYYYYNADTGASSSSGKLLATYIQQETMKRVNTTNRGVKGANFFVLRNTNMPSALLEGAFISDPDEEALLMTADFKQKLAEGVAAGVRAYFNEVGIPTAPVVKKFQVGAGTRTSVRVRDIAQGLNLSVSIRSSQPIAAEKSVYFTGGGYSGTYSSTGASQPRRVWYLPEGYTGSSWGTRVIVQNPNSSPARVTATFLYSSDPLVRSYTVAARSRVILNVNDILPNQAVATAITSDYPVTVEREMTFDYEGSSSPGYMAAKQTWYFAEGSGKAGNDTVLLFANPGGTDANATITLFGASGGSAQTIKTIPALSRGTLRITGLLADDFAIRVRSDRPIVTEREQYVTWNGKKTGFSSIGEPYASTTWYFAEGKTDSDSQTRLVVFNPGSTRRARLTVRIVKANGEVVRRVTGIDPKQRLSIDLKSLVGVTAFSFSLNSDVPVIAERTSIVPPWGLSNSIGSRCLSYTWYFADSSTRSGYDPRIIIYNPGTQAAEVTFEVQR